MSDEIKQQATSARTGTETSFYVEALTVLLFVGITGWLIYYEVSGVLRLVMGFINALVLPGFFIQLALYPRHGQITATTRTALTLGFSVSLNIVIIMLIDLIPALNIEPGVIFSSQVIVTALAFLSSYVQRRGMATAERSGAIPSVHLLRAIVRVRFLLALAVVVALIWVAVALLLVTSRSPNADLTEAYLLDADGTVQDYPFVVDSDDRVVRFIVGIRNQEGKPMRYTVEAYYGGSRIWQDDALTLPDGETHQYDLELTLPPARNETSRLRRADDSPYVSRAQPLTVYVFNQAQDDSPYRELRLWIEN